MTISSVGSAYTFLSTFSARSGNSAKSTPNLSESIAPSSAAPSSQNSGSYDFTAMSPLDVQKTTDELYNSGKITLSDKWLITTLFASKFEQTPDGGVTFRRLTESDGAEATQPRNILREFEQQIGNEKKNPSYLAPGQLELMQALYEKITALQNAPNGIDRHA